MCVGGLLRRGGQESSDPAASPALVHRILLLSDEDRLEGPRHQDLSHFLLFLLHSDNQKPVLGRGTEGRREGGREGRSKKKNQFDVQGSLVANV